MNKYIVVFDCPEDGQSYVNNHATSLKDAKQFIKEDRQWNPEKRDLKIYKLIEEN